MQDQLKQELIKLIDSSRLLNSAEKQEWTALLDLMDEKQAGELQKILNSAKQPVMPTITPKSTPPAMQQHKEEPKQESKPNPANLPLSHIVNLPNVPAEKVPVKPAVGTQFDRFKKDLDKILNEKELPEPPHQPEVVKKMVNFPEKPKFTPSLPKINITEPPVKTAPPANPPVMPVNIHPIQPPPRAGLEDTGIFMRAAAIKQEAGKNAVVAPHIEPKPAPHISGPAVNVKLENITDVLALTASGFNKQTHPVILEKLKKIITKNGYYQTIFNLEKSSLYQVYVDIGLKLLNNSGTFEGDGGKGMSKDQFEEFTDLLREIQVE